MHTARIIGVLYAAITDRRSLRPINVTQSINAT